MELLDVSYAGPGAYWPDAVQLSEKSQIEGGGGEISQPSKFHLPPPHTSRPKSLAVRFL